MNLFSLLRRFRKSDSGAAGTEFAFLASFVMVPLLLGSVEVIDALGVDKRAQNAAASLADVIARDTEVSSAEVNGLWRALDVLMYPDSAADMDVVLTSVRIVSTTSATVVWSDAHGDGAMPHSAGDPVVLDARMMRPGTSLVMVETTYPYTAPLGFLFGGEVNFNHRVYRRSRLVDPIPRVS